MRTRIVLKLVTQYTVIHVTKLTELWVVIKMWWSLRLKLTLSGRGTMNVPPGGSYHTRVISYLCRKGCLTIHSKVAQAVNHSIVMLTVEDDNRKTSVTRITETDGQFRFKIVMQLKKPINFGTGCIIIQANWISKYPGNTLRRRHQRSVLMCP